MIFSILVILILKCYTVHSQTIIYVYEDDYKHYTFNKIKTNIKTSLINPILNSNLPYNETSNQCENTLITCDILMENSQNNSMDSVPCCLKLKIPDCLTYSNDTCEKFIYERLAYLSNVIYKIKVLYKVQNYNIYCNKTISCDNPTTSKQCMLEKHPNKYIAVAVNPDCDEISDYEIKRRESNHHVSNMIFLICILTPIFYILYDYIQTSNRKVGYTDIVSKV